jgi:anti-sigma-K factor RskA
MVLVTVVVGGMLVVVAIVTIVVPISWNNQNRRIAAPAIAAVIAHTAVAIVIANTDTDATRVDLNAFGISKWVKGRGRAQHGRHGK